MEGLSAQRRALTSWLRELPSSGWDERSQQAVARVRQLYVGAVDRSITAEVPLHSPIAAADALDRLADAVERRFAEAADDRWELSREEFRRLEGTTDMGVEALMAELHDVARSLDVPTPSTAREAAVAAVVWRAADKVEAPVRIVLTSGRNFVVGPGEPEGVLHTDDDAVLDVATGRADPDELADEGRWLFEGPDEVRAAFDRTFRIGL
ncbi:MAG TPA: hypothetical protein VHF47_05200 [Acidimicrobiales bacterium]|nr:hypothetical protein [Acidimicrobiales bacterium]